MSLGVIGISQGALAGGIFGKPDGGQRRGRAARVQQGMGAAASV